MNLNHKSSANMSDKTYQSCFDVNIRPPCAQHGNQSIPQHCLSYPLSNTTVNTIGGMNQTASVCDVMCAGTGLYRYQNVQTPTSSGVLTNSASYCDQLDNWIGESRLIADIEKGLKFPDKIETIEITSKDLSPASCCSNVDLLLPDFYKNSSKESNYLNKMTEPQWFGFGSQKFNEYSSCAQMNTDNQITTGRYCNIQKNDLDSCGRSYLSSYSTECSFYNRSTQEYSSADFYYENRQTECSDMQQRYFCDSQNFTNPLSNVEQTEEISNAESDIIVEESDDDNTDFSEEQDKRYESNTNCIICNVAYAPHGSQFYYLTAKNPLTMSSQKPVFVMLTEHLGNLCLKQLYLCSQCLGLVNMLDHLQFKLDRYRQELYSKFENSCKEGNFPLPKGYDKTKAAHSGVEKNQILHKRFRCKLCKKIFSIERFCQYHLKRHKLKKRHLCDVCGQRYTDFSNFKCHIKSHKTKINLPKLTPFVCKLCNKIFRTNSNFREHSNFCSGLLPFACKYSECDKKFPTITKMKNHVKLKHDKKFASICSICNIGFVKISSYKEHMVSHSTEKKYNCTKCNKSYKTLSNLNFHLKYHNEKLPFICEICSKGFMRKEYLEAHLNGHNGIKNFVCQICDKKFVSQKNLDSHLKYHDGSIKKKSCGICGKVLTSGFEEHMRTHNNLREFECKECLMRFNTKGALIKHGKKKHSIEVTQSVVS